MSPILNLELAFSIFSRLVIEGVNSGSQSNLMNFKTTSLPDFSDGFLYGASNTKYKSIIGGDSMLRGDTSAAALRSAYPDQSSSGWC